MKVPKAFLLSSSLVFAHEEETLDTWEVGISLLLRLITYYTNTLIHQVIIEDVRKTDRLGHFGIPNLRANQGNLRFPAHFVDYKHEYSLHVLLLNRIILKDV